MLDLVCIGASQLHPLNGAYRERQRDGTADFNFYPMLVSEGLYRPGMYIADGKIKFNRRFDADFRDYLAGNDPPVIFTYFGGHEHVPIALINSPRSYDILLPDEADCTLAAGAEIIPYDLMMASCRFFVGGWLAWFPHLREFTDRPIYQIAVPPPITGDDHIRQHAGSDFTEQIERYGIAPERLRAKVWQICVKATEAQCAEHGVGVVGSMPETLDANHCLLPQFRGHDAVHPNNAYGHLLLDRMLSVAAEHRRGESA